MTIRNRLTRQESKEFARMRLFEGKGRLLIRKCSQRAMRNRYVRRHFAELRQPEPQTCSASVSQYLGTTNAMLADRKEFVGLVQFAVAHGLGSLRSIPSRNGNGPRTQAARLVFDRMNDRKSFN